MRFTACGSGTGAEGGSAADPTGSSQGSRLWLAVACILAILPGHAAVADPVASQADPALRPLSLLIQGYLDTQDTDAAQRTLEEILRTPQATLAEIERILSTGPVYGREPVGLQPGEPVRLRERTYQYGLYVPLSYKPTEEYPLVICLHGSGFTGDAYLERWQVRLGEAYILACPTLIQGTWWTRQAEELVLATLRAVRARYRVDPDRIFLTGMSNGGIGTYLVGAHHAPLFAGLAPMASGLDTVLLPFLKNLRNTPVYLIHGRKDQVMPVELSRTIAQELARLGYPHVYREHDRVHPMAGGHFFPREELPELIGWIGAQRRDPFPKKLTVVRDASHLMPFAWLRIDATDHIAALSDNLIDSRDEAVRDRLYATLDAEIVGPNRIEVRSQRVRRYSLFLNEHLADLTKPVTVVTDGRVSYQGPVTGSVEALLREARHRQDRRMLFPVSLTISVQATP